LAFMAPQPPEAILDCPSPQAARAW
jgi:hypothetical protein